MMKAITASVLVCHTYTHTQSHATQGHRGLREFVTGDTAALVARGAVGYDQGVAGLLWKLSDPWPGCLRSSRP